MVSPASIINTFGLCKGGAIGAWKVAERTRLTKNRDAAGYNYLATIILAKGYDENSERPCVLALNALRAHFAARRVVTSCYGTPYKFEALFTAKIEQTPLGWRATIAARGHAIRCHSPAVPTAWQVSRLIRNESEEEGLVSVLRQEGFQTKRARLDRHTCPYCDDPIRVGDLIAKGCGWDEPCAGDSYDEMVASAGAWTLEAAGGELGDAAAGLTPAPHKKISILEYYSGDRQALRHVYLGRRVAGPPRLNKREHIGPTSMNPELALSMAKQALVAPGLARLRPVRGHWEFIER
eukprot:m51a1_g1358 hypothetical protein (294) ;mRNA; r:384280-385678